ncbi:MAG: O-antigen ligase family protein [Lachnospiraceae bacterium]|nr:O-antigen ligase family protein [Lachnospiraceae bacterium]
MLSEKRISFKNIICALIIFLAVGAFAWIWLLGGVRNEVHSNSLGGNNRQTDALDGNNMVSQVFTPQNDYLHKLGVIISLPEYYSSDATFHVAVLDSKGGTLKSASRNYGEILTGTYDYYVLDVELVPGATYQFNFSVSGEMAGGLKLAYRDMQLAGPVENLGLNYNQTNYANGSLACSYVYKTDLSMTQVLVYGLFLAFIAGVLITLVYRFMPEKMAVKTVKADVLARVILTAGIVLVVLGLLYLSLVQKRFGTKTLDLSFYGVGLASLAVFSLTVVWKVQSILPRLEAGKWKEYALSAIRVITAGIYIILYVYYFNSGLNYGHWLGYSYMYVAFGVFTLTFFSKKEIFSYVSLVFSGVYWLFCAGWMATHTYAADMTTLYYVAITFGWLWGIILVRTVINLVRRKMSRLNILYTIVFFGFLVMQVIFNNGRAWTWWTLIFFGIFFLQKRIGEMWNKIANELCWAVLLSFWVLVIRAVLVRPYHKYIYTRYPGVFTSVAIWGVYLSMVLAVCLVKLVIEYKKDSRFTHNWFYYMTIAACNAYIVFSVSRTAMLTGIVVLVSLVILLSFTMYRKQIKKLVYMLLTGVGITVLLFPGFYSVTRIVPAIVKRPYIGIYEELWNGMSIYNADSSDSYKYIDVEKMLETCFDRIVSTFHDGDIVETDHLTYEEYYNLLLEIGNVAAEDSSGGRTTIWKYYLQNLTWEGHDKIWLKNGHEDYAHAHNVFIQVAHDSGILTGIWFLILGVTGVIRSLRYYLKKREWEVFTLLPLIVIITFGAAGMTEMVYHPTIPMTFILFLSQIPLLSTFKVKTEVIKEPDDEKEGIKF